MRRKDTQGSQMMEKEGGGRVNRGWKDEKGSRMGEDV